MNKEQLIRKVSRETQVSTKTVQSILESVLSEVSKSLQRGEKIQIKGFGVFDVKFSSPRVGRNPKTGKAIPIPARFSPEFKPSEVLKSKVRGDM